MSLYQHFLKLLERDFGEFVQSRRVNLYLQTIGPEIEGEDLQNGILYNFIIVSGYEEERGHWATAINNKLRFGDEIIDCNGLPDPIILTPNFFYGRNTIGDEIEYRLGLIKTKNRVKICPIILRNAQEGIQAKVLPDLCVIYTGIFIDTETAKQLGTQKTIELTTYQEFLTSFWNIDDYLRKQNPNFHSDFDIELWQGIEVFSGRIITQMLDTIMYTCQLNPDWLIEKARDFYCYRLISFVERSLDERTQISENQILIYVKNLCSYIRRFDLKPLELLYKKGINLVPFLIKGIINPPEEEMPYEAFYVLEKIIEFYPKLFENQAQTIIEMLAFSWKEESRYVYKILYLLVDKYEVITSEILIICLKLFSSPNKTFRLSALIAYKILIKQYPQYLTPETINSFQNLLNDPHRQVRISILRLFKQAIYKNPEFINQFFIDRICNLLQDPSKKVKIAALETFEAALPYLPDYINTQALNNVIQMLYNPNFDLRKITLQIFEILLNKKPQLFDLSVIETIHSLMSFQNPKKLKTILSAQKLIIQQQSDLICHTDIEILLVLISTPNKIIKLLALKNLGYIVTNCPELFGIHDVQRITELLLDPDKNVKIVTLWIYRAIIIKAPNLIDKKMIHNFLSLFSDSNKKVKKTAKRLYTLFSKSNTSIINNTWSHIPS